MKINLDFRNTIRSKGEDLLVDTILQGLDIKSDEDILKVQSKDENGLYDINLTINGVEVDPTKFYNNLRLEHQRFKDEFQKHVQHSAKQLFEQKWNELREPINEKMFDFAEKVNKIDGILDETFEEFKNKI